MVLEIKIPVIEEGVEEYLVSYWLKKDGDTVKRNEDLVELETDMDTYIIPADADGVLSIVAAEGTYLKPEDVLYTLKTND